MTLLEQYGKHLAVAKKNCSTGTFTKQKAVALAQGLRVVESLLSEGFETASATQMSNIGTFKRFVTNVAILAMPNLIAFDLVITKPMASRVGFLTYLKYQYGTNKGGIKENQTIQTPFSIKGTDTEYTSENVTVTGVVGTSLTAFGPVKADRQLTIGGGIVPAVLKNNAALVEGTDYTLSTDKKTITFTTALVANDTITYKYDNIQIPADKLPTLIVTQESITLEAKLRRIAVYYSTIAAMSAKIDYDIDLQAELVKKAQAQLSYEIDGDIVNQLYAACGDVHTELTWSKSLPVGVSKTEHYMGFTEIVSKASSYIFQQTGKFMATWMVIGSQVKPILDFIPGFSQTAQGNKVGPFLCGSLNGMQVFIDPRLPENAFFFGVKGADLETAAAVYAPYIPLAPTMLLEGPDHGSTQGWATMYDFKIINQNLLVKGAIVA